MKKYMAIVAALFGLAGFAFPAAAQTLDFTLSASSSDGKTVVPKLTWTTTPAATSCTASGDAAWTGSKAASGTVTLAGVTVSKTYTLVCNWPGVTKATLTWTEPTTNTDGSAYTDKNGYRIQWGNTGATEAQLDQTTYIPQSAGNTWQSGNLAAGTWYFGVKAVNSLGLESAISNIASKVMVAGANQSRSLALGVKFPGAPIMDIQ